MKNLGASDDEVADSDLDLATDLIEENVTLRARAEKAEAENHRLRTLVWDYQSARTNRTLVGDGAHFRLLAAAEKALMDWTNEAPRG